VGVVKPGALPEPIESVIVPDEFSPSRFSARELCLLKLVLDTLGKPDYAPPPHPRAVVGQVLHDLLERATHESGVQDDRLVAWLAELLERANRSFANAHTNPTRLEQTMSAIEWRRLRRRVLDRAAARLESNGAMVERGIGDYLNYLPEGGWAELPLRASQLRLKGKVDYIEVATDVVAIRDEKTGAVTDSKGEIKESITLQLQLYGLMALELGAEQVELWVDGDQSEQVEFSRDQQQQVREWLSDLLSRLPPKSHQAADPLASPGAACRWCLHRPVCQPYQQAAPHWWQQPQLFRPPLDTWGSVEEIRHTDRGTCIELEDAAGRAVRIVNLQLDPGEVGSKVFLFSLGGWLRPANDDRWWFPANFFELPSRRGDLRAWAAQAFVHSDGCWEA
jgi:RecB family exonuclease